MYFYLDKELAKQGTSCCFWKSETKATNEELELVRKHFNFKGEFLIFEGIDIPHKFKYNKELDIIEELIEIEEIAPRMLSEEIQEVKSEFDESVEIEPEIYYFYIDKEIADKFYVAETITTFRKPVLDPNTYFTKPTYMIKGKHTPYYITVEDGVIREATEYEKYTRGQRKLNENEAIFKEDIIILNPGQYIDEEKQEIITVPCPPEYLVNDWDKENHIWIDLTTDYDRVQAQYVEYEPLDTYSTVKQMERQDPALSEEYVNMMIELRVLMDSLREQKQISRARTMSIENKGIEIHQPSEALINFKNKFNSK